MSKLTVLSTFKPKNYNYSLVEYLNRELKQNNIKCKKRVSYIDIDMDSIVDDVYNKLVVDCFNGNIYLRGNNVKDKRILKVRRFGGYRDSDALYCAKGACKQIIRILNKFKSNSDNLNKTASIDLRGKKLISKRIICSDFRQKIKNNYIDLRGKVAMKNKTIIKDLRKQSNDFRKIVVSSRDYAIAIINGVIYEGDTHGECVTKFLKELGIEDIEFYDRIDLREILGYNFYTQFAAAHVFGNKIYLDNYSLENITREQAVNLILSEYPDYEILDYDTNEKLAIYLDKNNRDSAILYINGEIFEGNDHWDMMEKYVNNNLNIVRSDYNSELDYQRALEDAFDDSSYATGNRLDNKIYFEEDFLNNCNTDEIERAVNNTFPNCEVLFHEYDEDACKQYITDNIGEDLYNNYMNSVKTSKMLNKKER